MPKIKQKDRCTSRFQTRGGILRCMRVKGHEGARFDTRHINERSGYESAWTDEQAVKE